ncbi:MAG: alpha/beta fold hydrolase, partial [Solirubrobacteraceae bacterium]
IVQGQAVLVAPGGRDRAVLELAGGPSVVEHARRLPPFSLAATIAEPAGCPPIGPTVVLLNAGLIHKVGPGRVFVELGRNLACAGMRTVRLDLPGIGDSEPRPGQPSAPYPTDAASQLVETLRALDLEDPSDVVLVGLCSGGFHASRAAVALGARGVCLINPALFPRVPPPPTVTTPEAAAEQVLGIANPLIRYMRRSPVVKRLAQVPKLRRMYYSEGLARAVDRLPLVWTLLDVLGVAPSPTRHLRALRANGVRTLLLCGPGDARRYRRRAALIRRLQRDGGLRFVELDGIDHSLFSESARRRALQAVESHVLSTYLRSARGASRSEAESPARSATRRAAAPPGQVVELDRVSDLGTRVTHRLAR